MLWDLLHSKKLYIVEKSCKNTLMLWKFVGSEHYELFPEWTRNLSCRSQEVSSSGRKAVELGRSAEIQIVYLLVEIICINPHKILG